MNDRLIELTRFWYEYVGVDHHKDRDCHFYINQVFSYGQEPYYRIEHYGYITELNDDNHYHSYDEAHAALHNWLLVEAREAITDWLSRDPATFKDHDFNCESALAVCQKYKHLIPATPPTKEGDNE